MNESEYAILESLRKTRKLHVGRYLVEHPDDSIRDIAKLAGASPYQVWTDIQDLEEIDYNLYEECRSILESHKNGQYIISKRRN